MQNQSTRGEQLVMVQSHVKSESGLLVEANGGASPVQRYLDGLAPGSRRTLRQALDRIASLLTRGKARAETLAWHKLRPRNLVALTEQLKKTYSAATTNKMLSAFRGVMREAMGLGLLDEKDFAKMAALPSVKNQRVPSGRTLTGPEVKSLFRACMNATGAASCRDAALVALLFGGGLRRSEAVALQIGDYEQSSGLVRVSAGEGKARVVRAEGRTRGALEAWLDVRGKARGAFLCPVDKAGRVHVRHMTDQAVLYIVRRLAEQAGIKRFSPHDLRRTYFFKMRQRGGRGRRKDAGGAAPGMDGTKEHPGVMLDVPFEGCEAS
jgi:integrase/recombinase XerD